MYSGTLNRQDINGCRNNIYPIAQRETGVDGAMSYVFNGGKVVKT